MKYWWLEKYKNLQLIKIPELIQDMNHYLIMPKNYLKYYNEILKKETEKLTESEMLIFLYVTINKKNIKNSKVRIIIDELLEIKDNSFPPSDYNQEEMLNEIKNLRTNLPFKEKLEKNNIAICYQCLNVFYIDQIKTINKNDLCICPFCQSKKLYFDNDYIPMNYTFIKIANLYYRTSRLGTKFKNLQKMLKKNIIIEENSNSKYIDTKDIFNKEKIKPIDEKIIHHQLYRLLMKEEQNLEYQVNLSIPILKPKQRNHLLLILMVTLMDILSNTVYLKNIKIITNSTNKEEIKKIIKEFTNKNV